ncbi:hypothetical protein [Streptomyces sp. NPDC058475]|uniref:hypothetical protein n=1 Tax=Streptomyces sp. NPDC058475 TaxID=3346518 RepID=UPI003657222E
MRPSVMVFGRQESAATFDGARLGSHAGNTAEVPIVVHPAIEPGGRLVVVRNEVAGLAHCDHDVVEYLRRAGLAVSQDILDDPVWVEWRGGLAHDYQAA